VLTTAVLTQKYIAFRLSQQCSGGFHSPGKCHCITEWLVSFWDSIIVSSSRICWTFQPLKMEAWCCFKALDSSPLVMWYDIPEKSRPQKEIV